MADDLASRLSASIGRVCSWWSSGEVYDPKSPGGYRATLSLEARSLDANGALRLALELRQAAAAMGATATNTSADEAIELLAYHHAQSGVDIPGNGGHPCPTCRECLELSRALAAPGPAVEEACSGGTRTDEPTPQAPQEATGRRRMG